MSDGKKIRVLVVSASVYDVPNFYRTSGPLLSEPDRYEVVATDREEIGWLDLLACDIVCIPRIYRNDELRILELAKAAGRPVWVDYDDNLLEVPESNPAYIEFSQPSARESILTALAMADVVTVSTEALRALFQQARPPEMSPVVLVRNGLNPFWPKRAATHARSDTFYWRGSSTHITDVMQYSAAIAAGLPETASFHILGWFAWPLASAVLNKTGENLSYTKELPLNMYFRELENSGATCCVVPLEDNAFNRCKSNIAQLEAIAVGALAIVPDWPEWQLPGAIVYRDDESLEKAVAQYMETPYEERLAMWETARAGAEEQSRIAREKRFETLSTVVAPHV
jgi:hypothetical protein